MDIFFYVCAALVIFLLGYLIGYDLSKKTIIDSDKKYKDLLIDCCYNEGYEETIAAYASACDVSLIITNAIEPGGVPIRIGENTLYVDPEVMAHIRNGVQEDLTSNAKRARIRYGNIDAYKLGRSHAESALEDFTKYREMLEFITRI